MKQLLTLALAAFAVPTGMLYAQPDVNHHVLPEAGTVIELKDF
jgi:hypothetical protein